MSLVAFVLIVLSAALHATWNLLAKKSSMSVPFYALMCTVSAVAWLHVQFWTPIPLSSVPLKFWGMTLSSVFCDSCFYCVGLVLTYRYFEISTAYPVMRSLPILMTAAAVGMLGLGTPLSGMAKFGFPIVFIGAMLMPLAKFSDFKLSNYFRREMLYVLLTACGTTGYTIFDSQAQKALGDFVAAAELNTSKEMVSLTYYSTRGICLSSTMWILSMATLENRKAIRSLWKNLSFNPILGGICGSGTYVLVLIAMNYVTNVSYVQVFRQLGLPIGMLGGIWFLKERCTATKIVGVTLILLGLTLSVLK